MYKKTIYLVLIVAILAAFTVPVMASGPVDVSHPLYQQYTVTQEEKEKFNPYVLLNEETHQYSIKAEAAIALTTEEYQKLQRQIDQTNAFLATVDFAQYGDEIFVIAPEQESSSIALYANGQYVEGFTKIETYWWGVRIYLSKTDARLALSGAATIIGTITVESVVISAACAVISVFGPDQIQGGIMFDYNCIGLIFGVPGIILATTTFVSSVQYQ